MPATTSHPLQPQELEDYANAWQSLIEGQDTEKLRGCFTSDSGALSNYTYLPLAYAKQLVAGGPLAIQSMLVAVPSDGQTVFSTVFFGINEDGHPTSELYLAGVAVQPAEVISTPVTEPPITSFDHVSLDYATNIIDRWKKQPLDKVSPKMFTTAEGPLRLFTHDLGDFKQAIADAESKRPAYDALWFSFALHELITPKFPVLFATVMCLNDLPPVDKSGIIRLNAELKYYDLSKPCPPACYEYLTPPATVAN